MFHHVLSCFIYISPIKSHCSAMKKIHPGPQRRSQWPATANPQPISVLLKDGKSNAPWHHPMFGANQFRTWNLLFFGFNQSQHFHRAIASVPGFGLWLPEWISLSWRVLETFPVSSRGHGWSVNYNCQLPRHSMGCSTFQSWEPSRQVIGLSASSSFLLVCLTEMFWLRHGPTSTLDTKWCNHSNHQPVTPTCPMLLLPMRRSKFPSQSSARKWVAACRPSPPGRSLLESPLWRNLASKPELNKQLLPHPPFRGVHESGATIEEMWRNETELSGSFWLLQCLPKGSPCLWRWSSAVRMETQPAAEKWEDVHSILSDSCACASKQATGTVWHGFDMSQYVPMMQHMTHMNPVTSGHIR